MFIFAQLSSLMTSQMNIFSKLIHRQTAGNEPMRVGGMEDFMQLIRVYYQATMASNIGISNISMLPDMAVFKRTLKIPTQNNKLGIAEKAHCKKMMQNIYNLSDNFFAEIDASIKKNVRNMNTVQPYLFKFQGFSQDLLMLVGNIMQWKFRMPSVFKKLLHTMCEKAVNDIMTKTDWKDDGVRKTCASIHQYLRTLGFSSAWMTEYIYNIVLLAKKEPKPKE